LPELAEGGEVDIRRVEGEVRQTLIPKY
jgi:hypothetical protein